MNLPHCSEGGERTEHAEPHRAHGTEDDEKEGAIESRETDNGVLSTSGATFTELQDGLAIVIRFSLDSKAKESPYEARTRIDPAVSDRLIKDLNWR